MVEFCFHSSSWISFWIYYFAFDIFFSIYQVMSWQIWYCYWYWNLIDKNYFKQETFENNAAMLVNADIFCLLTCCCYYLIYPPISEAFSQHFMAEIWLFCTKKELCIPLNIIHVKIAVVTLTDSHLHLGSNQLLIGSQWKHHPFKTLLFSNITKLFPFSIWDN